MAIANAIVVGLTLATLLTLVVTPWALMLSAHLQTRWATRMRARLDLREPFRRPLATSAYRPSNHLPKRPQRRAKPPPTLTLSTPIYIMISTTH